MILASPRLVRLGQQRLRLRILGPKVVVDLAVEPGELFIPRAWSLGRGCLDNLSDENDERGGAS